MSKIIILPEKLSNQIAAGEVVERPASVVKELVENSIDAGSRRIIVEIEQGGRQKIRVYDDGEGMSQEEALLSIERYATSKIKDDSDLFKIRTLGFRGEALPSIASVSHFSILTKSRFENSGTFINIKGGKLLDVIEKGTPDGTDINVSHLFFNTPARRKFLKTVNTETGHISETLACLALGNPDIYFKLVHNKKNIKEWQSGRLEERVADILGKDYKNSIYPVSNVKDNLSVEGFAGSPDITRSSSSKIYIFVNGRYIKDRSIAYAVYQGYEGRIMKGRYPGCVIFINLPFDKVDVNVHPTKHEVRFADQKFVMECVKNGIFKALEIEDKKKWKGIQSQNQDFRKTLFKDEKPKEAEYKSFFDKNNEIEKIAENKNFQYNINSFSRKISDSSKKPYFFRDSPEINENTDFKSELKKPEKKEENISFYTSLKIIGQFKNTYIICESSDKMILVDQHAAHERVRFETLLNSYKKLKPVSQQLLMPQVIEPSVKESEKLLLMLEEFKKFGLEISHYGGTSFAVQSVPLVLGSMDFKPLIMDLSSMIGEISPSCEISAIISDAIALIACHSSIRANHMLLEKEISVLFENLDKCQNSSRCPHGRPIWISFEMDLIEKAFKRKV